MTASHWVLVVVLVLDALQLALALRVTRRHGALLASGAVVLAVAPVLGLAGVLSTTTALLVAVVLEVAGGLAARAALERLHRRGLLT